MRRSIRHAAAVLAGGLAGLLLLPLPAAATEHTTVSEACNGRDDDGDGLVDNGCDARCDAPRAAPAVDLNHDVPEAAAQAWTGKALAVLWSENTGAVRIGTFRQDGSVRRPAELIDDQGPAETLAMLNDALLLVYRRGYAGNRVVELRDPDDLHILCSREYVEDRGAYRAAFLKLRWSGRRSEALLSLSGGSLDYMKLEDCDHDVGWTQIDAAAGPGEPAASRREDIVGIAWPHDYDFLTVHHHSVRFRRFDFEGNPAPGSQLLELTDDLDHDPGFRPQIVWRDDEWGVLHGDADSTSRLQRISPADEILETIDVGPGTPVDLAWTGQEYAMLLQNRNALELYRYDPASGTLDGPVEVDLAAEGKGLAWTGFEYEALSFQGDRLALRRIACCDDADGDGWDECRDREDREPDAHPSATELCNGLDDDEDGQLDEGCPRDCPHPYARIGEVRITDDPGSSRTSYAPSLAWRSDREHLTWLDDRSGLPGAWYQPLDRDGRPLEAPASASERAHPTEHLGLSAFRERAAVWSAEPDADGTLRLAMDPYGAPFGEQPLFPEANGSPAPLAALWSGTAHAVLLEEGGTWTLGRYDLGGHLLHPREPLLGAGARPAGGPAEAAFAWNGDGYGLVWTDVRGAQRKLYFRPLSFWGWPSGGEVPVGGDVVPVPHDSQEPSLAWKGDGYALAWSDDRNGPWQIFFALLDPDGSLVDPPGEVPVSAPDHDARQPAIAWNGEEYAIAYEWYPHPWESEIHVTRVLSDGTVTGEEAVLGTAPGPSTRPSLVWTGDEWSCAWTDERDDNDEIYFAPIACCRAAAAPGIVGGLAFEPGSRDTFSWDPEPNAEGYDVLRGDLDALVRTGGDFASAVDRCLADDQSGTSFTDAFGPPGPADVFYLVRAENCLGAGSWDSGGPGQVGSRDPGIAASPEACP